MLVVKFQREWHLIQIPMLTIITPRQTCLWQANNSYQKFTCMTSCLASRDSHIPTGGKNHH